jgi:predicted HTH transcriptional regulator
MEKLFFASTADSKADLEESIPNYLIDDGAPPKKSSSKEEKEEKKDSDRVPKRMVSCEEESKAKMRKLGKEGREEKKAKKMAEIASVDEMAEKIFKHQSDNECTSCSEIKKKLQVAEETIDDLLASLEAKKLVIKHLQEEVDQKETKDDFSGSKHLTSGGFLFQQ